MVLEFVTQQSDFYIVQQTNSICTKAFLIQIHQLNFPCLLISYLRMITLRKFF